MNIFILLWAVISITVAAEREPSIRKSGRTGRQFGWQTPYTISHNYIHSAREKITSAQEKYANQIQEAQRNPKGSKGSALTILQETLNVQPTKVNTSLNVSPMPTTEFNSVVERDPALSNKMLHSYQQYNRYPGYSNVNLQPHQQAFGSYGNRRDPLNDIYSPMYDYLGVNQHQNNVWSGLTGQYPMHLGHPSYGVPGQYTPSGGVESNFNYLSNSLMAMGSQPTPDPENTSENLVPSSFLFECPLDYSFQSHIVGQATIFPDPLKCDRFYYCHMGHAYVFQCSDNLYYNPDIKACDERHHFSCGNRAI